MKQNAIAALAGLFFGFGLGLSQMVDRERVLGFLDVAGDWDPTLLFVLGGAVGVTLVTFQFVLRRSRPLLAPRFLLPTRQDIDRPLVLGALLFGIGWGIAGYCPGPGLVALVQGSGNPAIFLSALIVGSLTQQWLATTSKQKEPKQSS